jgi:hypothetical protein
MCALINSIQAQIQFMRHAAGGKNFGNLSNFWRILQTLPVFPIGTIINCIVALLG